jgi:hypothetical protein
MMNLLDVLKDPTEYAADDYTRAVAAVEELTAATRAFLTDDGSPNLARIMDAMGPFGGVAP